MSAAAKYPVAMARLTGIIRDLIRGQDVEIDPSQIAAAMIDRWGARADLIPQLHPHALTLLGLPFAVAEKITAEGGLWGDTYRTQALLRLAYDRTTRLASTRADQDALRLAYQRIEKKEAADGAPMTSPDDIARAIKQFYICATAHGVTYVSDPAQDRAETSIARILLDLACCKRDKIVPADDRLDNAQRAAVETLSQAGVGILTGGPGTGKTETLSAIVAGWDGPLALLAPTGIAAERMAAATRRPASTIHRALWVRPTLDGGYRAERTIMPGALVIVDEASMIDIFLCQALLEGCQQAAGLLFVGDVDQLPAIGRGQVLRDIIESTAFPVVRLTHQHRSTPGIQRAAADVLARRHVAEEDGDFRSKYYYYEDEKLLRQALGAYTKAHRRGVGFLDLSILTPLRNSKYLLSVENFNAQLHHHYYGSLPYFQPGEPVIVVKNNYKLQDIDGRHGIFNGMRGIVTTVTSDTCVVDFGGRIIDLGGHLDLLDLAYAMSVHKAQGCTIPYVIIALPDDVDSMCAPSLLYVAITRASRGCLLLHANAALYNVLHEEMQPPRLTGLVDKIKREDGRPITDFSEFHRYPA